MSSGLDEALDILERADGSGPDNSPLYWDGWHAAIAAVRVALTREESGLRHEVARLRAMLAWHDIPVPEVDHPFYVNAGQTMAEPCARCGVLAVQHGAPVSTGLDYTPDEEESDPPMWDEAAALAPVSSGEDDAYRRGFTDGRGEPPERGTVTQCPIEGVHEHAFRGPHGFREWLDSSSWSRRHS